MFLAFFLSLVNFRVAKLDVSHMTFLFFLSFFLIKLNDTLYFYCHLKNKVLHEEKQTFFFFLKSPISSPLSNSEGKEDEDET